MAPEVANEVRHGVDAFGVRRRVAPGDEFPPYLDPDGEEGVQPSDRAADGQADPAEVAQARRAEADDEGRGPVAGSGRSRSRRRGSGDANAGKDGDADNENE